MLKDIIRRELDQYDDWWIAPADLDIVAENIAEAISKRPEYGPGKSHTHWHECWRYTSHHACAVAEIERLRAAMEIRTSSRRRRGKRWGRSGRRLDMTELHSTTAAVLEAIKAFWAEKDFSPAIHDIMEATDITSKSAVHYHILKLEQVGLIKRTPRVARSYVPIENDGEDACMGTFDLSEDEDGEVF